MISQKTDYALALAEKLPDPSIKDKLYQRVEGEMANFLNAPRESFTVKNRATHLLGPRKENGKIEQLSGPDQFSNYPALPDGNQPDNHPQDKNMRL